MLKNDRHTYRITWSEQDNKHIGLCAEFSSLSWLAPTPETALQGIRQVVADVVADMQASDEGVPEADELHKHYSFDYSKVKPNRFADRFSEQAIVVVLDPDVAAVFTTSEAANQALRGLITALESLAETSDLLEKVKSSSASSQS